MKSPPASSIHGDDLPCGKFMDMKFFLPSLFLFFSLTIIAQQPVIGLLYNQDGVTPGYTLFNPEPNGKVYLIDNCGQKIKEWNFTQEPGSIAYLLDNGNILQAGLNNLEIRDWDDNLVWSFNMNDNGFPQHHDIEPMPNGNILCLLADRYTQEEIVALGRDPLNTANNFKMDRLVELEPVGTDEANVVWAWKFADHLVQDFDSNLPNYGNTALAPGKLDLNYANFQTNDYTHCNSVDYNADLDQIIISARHFDEIFIIDHNTTIAEAAGPAGDFLWRWGNPEAYGAGDADDQQLFGQHDARWIPAGYPDEHKIMVFNNGLGGSSVASEIAIIDTDNGNYTTQGGVFLPEQKTWSWSGAILGETMLELRKSGAFPLENGHILICESGIGRLSEIDRDGNLYWSYRNPQGSTLFPQYSTGDINTPLFRGEKYMPNHPALVGKDLTPQGIIEDENTVSASCILSTSNTEIETLAFSISPNPARDNIEISLGEITGDFSLNIHDGQGKFIQELNLNNSSGNYSLDISGYPSGVLFISIESKEGIFTKKFLKM